jgi:uncharacterized protein YlbG (UPF0298 family)
MCPLKSDVNFVNKRLGIYMTSFFLNSRHRVPSFKLIKSIRLGLKQDVEEQLTSNTANNNNKQRKTRKISGVLDALQT